MHVVMAPGSLASATTALRAGLPALALPAATHEIRRAVRQFIVEYRRHSSDGPLVNSWLVGWDSEFSAELGRRGWVGMALPKEYGGHDASAVSRFVVAEELLAA